ncbi:MAG: HNH endonuclease [Bacillota bacterium]
MQKQEFLSKWLEIIKNSSAIMLEKQNFVNSLLKSIRNCSPRHTYDIAWMRAMLDILEKDEASPGKGGIMIDLHLTAARMISYYWDQTAFFELVQGPNPARQPDLIARTGELIKSYYRTIGIDGPVPFEKARFNTRLRGELEELVQAAVEILKNDVVAGFFSRGQWPENFHKYNRGEQTLLLSPAAASAISENSLLITETVYYRWTQILENYNLCPRLNRKIRIIDSPDPRDRQLSFYSKYLDLENPEHLCFICGRPVDREELQISHVIPWSCLCSDDIWNLVYTHGKCRWPGSRPVPSEFFIARLEKRNRKLLSLLDQHVEEDIVAGALQDAVSRDLLKKSWILYKN